MRPRYCKRNGSKTVLRMSSTHRWGVSVPLMMTKGGPGVKQNAFPDHNFWLRAFVECNSESRISTLPWASPDTVDRQNTVENEIRC
ncbi:hypothetical protein TNCV_2720521 [Trichonephila clavipes]|nr:hypothetical protein TNCV_2720521 [Trichonephila clavipes]